MNIRLRFVLNDNYVALWSLSRNCVKGSFLSKVKLYFKKIMVLKGCLR